MVLFLPDPSGQRATLYAARPTPHSATTSLLFASALLIYHADSSWRKRASQVGVLAALVLPALAIFSYILEFSFPPSHAPAPRTGLSVPAVVLYFALGSGISAFRLAQKCQNLPPLVPLRFSGAGCRGEVVSCQWSVVSGAWSVGEAVYFKNGLFRNAEVELFSLIS